MTLIFDAGALIALERGDTKMWKRLAAAAHVERELPVTHGGVVGQAWRGGARQARLARALPGIEVLDLSERLGRLAGELMGRAGTSDVVDAALISLAADGDIVYTSDVGDLKHLAEVRGLDVDIVRV